ncbi:outer membrane protein assembly factor BamD [Frigoriflavimonas asaccharolytica]|uniref:Outer membrane protein assembly factor BamD n=1 Tax=Frigoriflavimonas asaccharolytica TaxID=2735899 RepID=A0A8J8G8P3_9FLAO|nr:outer membrane protein assembly factor BamD [Frigoriflavimonas asaccharolytica]NRS93369.1 outer membrane protein assembly factor BamD [Frigoriflavimonas asaccharolytica]
MKKYILILLAFFTVAACNSQYDKAMKSADKDLIIKAANDYYAKKKWTKALGLYERVTNLVSGTDEMANVVYNTAYANYYDKNYKLAGYQFKNFSVSFPQEDRTEDAAYMSALCYYKGSMQYNLDQSSTDSAINELQNFINNYPESEKSKNINDLIDELSYKLEFKAYENAKQYYKMGEYKAANVAFENVLNDFPSTKLRVDIVDYLMKDRFELGMKSSYDLKEERLESAIAYSKQLEREFPNTDTSKDAVAMRKKLEAEKVSFGKLKLERNFKIAELTARQKREENRLADKNNKEENMKNQEKSEINTRQSLRDSAKIATPPPAATFKIKR